MLCFISLVTITHPFQEAAIPYLPDILELANRVNVLKLIACHPLIYDQD